MLEKENQSGYVPSSENKNGAVLGNAWQGILAAKPYIEESRVKVDNFPTTQIPEDSGSMLDTIKADRSVWLMKCPQVIGQAWKDFNDLGQPVAKITVSVDPCKTDDQRIEGKVEDPTTPSAMTIKVEMQEMSSTVSQTQSTCNIKSEFIMEVAANGSVTVRKSYTLNMSNDIIPMYIGGLETADLYNHMGMGNVVTVQMEHTEIDGKKEFDWYVSGQT